MDLVDSLVARGTWAQLGLLLALTLLVAALGFYRVVYFVSLGYGLSIAASAAVAPLLHRRELDLLALLQLAALLAYGLRLALFLLLRERSPAYRQELVEVEARGARLRGPVKAAIWLAVAALYVALFAPALFVLEARRIGAAPPLLPLLFGVATMAFGLLVESAADRGKSRYKAVHPKRFCDVGLYRLVRCPNYLGECIFWIGQFVAGLGAYRGLDQWAVAAAGLGCILLVMLGSTRRLELKQDQRYGDDPEYQRYARTVPILFPWLPIYSLRNWRIYLG